MSGRRGVREGEREMISTRAPFVVPEPSTCCPYCGAPVVDPVAYRDDQEFRCPRCLEFVQGDMWTKYASERVMT
jgi:ribosomal protein L37AE/L43A